MRALISVFDKEHIADFAKFLFDSGWEIVSTGGSAKYLAEHQIGVTDVSEITGFAECLDGRVKTLHPAIHAGLLAKSSDKAHEKTLSQLHITRIDLLCVNLYPFFEKMRDGALTDAEKIEFIDIGGPAMLRAASKNFGDVIVLTDSADYALIRQLLEKSPSPSPAAVPLSVRRHLAAKAFNLTGAYDAAVSHFLFDSYDSYNSCDSSCSSETTALSGSGFPDYFTVPLKKKQILRYGENAHQTAALYERLDTTGIIGSMRQLQGKELSYNNIRDLDIAWKCATAAALSATASMQVSVAAIKHNSPCAAALGATPLEAYTKAHNADSVSIFGGIVACTSTVDAQCAKEMSKTFLEVIAAPDFSAEALQIFSAKKNVRIISIPPFAQNNSALDFMAVSGGVLVQSCDTQLFEKFDTVTEAKPTAQQIALMKFGMSVAIYAKSNAILVIADDFSTCGIGAGQTNRIWAASQALSRAKTAAAESGKSAPSVLVSDAFFPFRDCVDGAAKYGITAIVQPGGSVRDAESIEACNEHGIAMVFTGTRHFKH